MDENGLDANEEYTHAVMSFGKLECYGHLLRAFKTMRELGFEQKELLCKAALRAVIKLDKHSDVFEICHRPSGSEHPSARLYTYALKKARAANKHDLVDIIFGNMKQVDAIVKKPNAVAKKPTTAEFPQDVAAPEIMARCLKNIPNRLNAYSAALQVAGVPDGKQEMVPKILDHLLKTTTTPNEDYLTMLRKAKRAKRHGLIVAITDHAVVNGVNFTDSMCEIILELCACERPEYRAWCEENNA